ncbi:sushi domain-containing protein 2-like [Physella acuta]|uniref:sushi domain-containing protein 2-like n=1 Tax=Physella acuta TaxID=109671 RepID=UPI0027DB6BC7|nr:sushi domain-containing protein 2-like [Physella acuta]
MVATRKMALKLFLCVLGFSCFGNNIFAHANQPIEPNLSNPPLFNYGLQVGDKEVDNEVKLVELPFNVSYFGSSYKQIYISADGTIGFTKALTYTSTVKWTEGVRNPDNDVPFIAPLYYSGFRLHNTEHSTYQGRIYYNIISRDELRPEDLHYSEYRNLLLYIGYYLREAVVHQPKKFDPELAVLVTWDNVATGEDNENGNACTRDEPCSGATFQMLLVADRQNTYTVFNYGKMDIHLKPTYQAGFNGGYGRGWFNVIPCHGTCTLGMNSSVIAELPRLKGSNHKGRFVLKVDGELIIRGGCLPAEIQAGMLELYPTEVGMFGGEKLEVSGKCLARSDKIYCKFGEQVVEGTMINEQKGFCPVPKMTRVGPVTVYWSSDRQDWSVDNVVIVVVAEDVDPAKRFALHQTEQLMQWYTRDVTTITIPWDPQLLMAESSVDTEVELRLLGYRELDNKVEYTVLENLGKEQLSRGQFSFPVEGHRCKHNCGDYEIGLFEVALPTHFQGTAAERVAIRYGPFPLGWYMNEDLTERMGSDWSDQKCRAWSREDGKSTDWIQRLPPCPCSLAQALADFGRFQADPSCNIQTGSKCHYHKEAVHCVRSVWPTADKAGNQCCYSNSGELMFSQLNYQGSSPDRSHVWGAAPYDRPDLVPSLSHWKHDVISFYYCCRWNDYALCDLYMDLRPTTDCLKYSPPGLAFLRGDPHVSTFDGQRYTFVGGGDFWLVKEGQLSIQGSFSQRPNARDIGHLSGKQEWHPKALISLTVKHADDDLIEVHPGPDRAVRTHGLELRVSGERKFFFKQATKWQNFKGVSVINNARDDVSNHHDNFTILLSNDVGVQVAGVNGLLHVTVALPPSLKMSGPSDKPYGQGLMGTFDDVINNDFTSRSGTVTTPTTEKSDLYQSFAVSWGVAKHESLFHFPKAAESAVPPHPFYELSDIPWDIPGEPSEAEVRSLCGSNNFCEWDYRITGDKAVAMATREADVYFNAIKSGAYKVENCGLPDIGRMAKLSAYNFSVGREIRVTGCDNDWNFAGDATFRCVRERLDEAEEKEREDYGEVVTDPHDLRQYIIHWVPKPYTVCYDEDIEAASLGLIIGCAVGAAVLVIVIIIIVIVVIRRKKSSGKSRPKGEKPKSSQRRGQEGDPAAAESMLREVEDRSPVYRVKKDVVRMSDVEAGRQD